MICAKFRQTDEKNLMICAKFRQFDEKIRICAKVFFPWDAAKVFCKAFCPMGKKALQKINLTEKLKLQRKFLPDSLFSKPYRNNNFLTPFLKKVSH